MNARCAQCGTQLPQGVLFCGKCGARLDAQSAAGKEEAPGFGDRADADDPIDGLLGRIVDGRYRVLSKLGEGGMGAVYQVEHVHMGKYMAMKLLLREFSGHKEVVRRFRREAQAISKLTHPHTVQVFDFGRTPEGAMYMVMEYLHGETLADVITREGPLPPKRVGRIVSQICSSLAEAHALGIIHRDLKPENVMMVRARDQRDYVKVLDFGLAKLRDRTEREHQSSHGSLVGTPYYMSPEQIRGGEIDARTDIYSLGAMTFKMLTGDPPFRAPSPIAVLTRHLHDPAPRLSSVRPELEGSLLGDVVLRAMAKDPKERYPSVDALREAVETAAHADVATSSASMARASAQSVPVPPTMIGDAWAADRAEFAAFERRMRLKRVLAFLSLMAILGGGVGALLWGYLEGGWFERTSESEPNNQRGQANYIELNKPIKGFIGKRLADSQGDIDWYRVRPEKGASPSLLRIEVTPVPNIDLVVEAYEGDKKTPAFVANEHGVGRGELIPNLRFDGPVFIRIAEAPGVSKVPNENSSDAYTVVATPRTPAPNEEREPNDDLYSAQEMPIDAPIRGSHGRKGDADYYRFPRTGTKDEVFEVKWTGVPGVTAELHVITANTQLLDKVPGRVVLPEGDNAFYITIVAKGASEPRRQYTLEVVRGKPPPPTAKDGGAR